MLTETEFPEGMTIEMLRVLRCVFLLNQQGRDVDLDDVEAYLRERYGMTASEAQAAIDETIDGGWLEAR